MGKAEYVELEFEQGVPVAVNGKKMSPANIVENLNEIGIRNGVGILCASAKSMASSRERMLHSRQGAIIASCGASAFTESSKRTWSLPLPVAP